MDEITTCRGTLNGLMEPRRLFTPEKEIFKNKLDFLLLFVMYYYEALKNDRLWQIQGVEKLRKNNGYTEGYK